MKVVIIEDEKITAKDLKRTILAVEPDVKIMAMLHSVEEAVDYFKKNDDTDLIFSDIQLGDGLSFDILKKMDNQVPVIFCTAFNTYFSEAFDATGIDYILKPFSKRSVEKALAKYITLQTKFTSNKDGYKKQLALLETNISPKKTAVIIRQRDKIIPLEINHIALFFIEHGYTFALTFNQEKFMVSEHLEELEASFSPQFFRTNRQYLVSRKAIKDATHFFNRKMIVNLSIQHKEQILVGKLKTSSFVEWLSNN